MKSALNKADLISHSILAHPPLLLLPVELKPLLFMSRSLAEAWAKACCASSSGSVAHVPPPLPLLDVQTIKLWLSTNPQNCISPNPLCLLVPATQHLTNWLNPFGIVNLDHLSHQYPVDIVICHCLCLTNSVQPSTLSSYSAGLLRFTKFCNDIGIPESECMPASESLISHFIVSHGATSVGKGIM